jgi:hypothetical protein
MKVAVRKLRVEDVEKLQALVVENFDAIEPGLTVLDARLLLGHATIDVIGVDAVGALVLGNVGFSANEDMLLKAVEAYSWCLEYPEAVVRLYPSCHLSDDRPPRLLFVVERMPDAFHRKIKQLGFPEVDCVEFRHLEFDGVPAVYFESLLRLRRSGAAVSYSSDSETPPSGEKAAPRSGAVVRASGVKLPKLGQATIDTPGSSPRAAERSVPAREPAAVVSMVSRQNAVPTLRSERPRPAEPVVLREPEPLAADCFVDAGGDPAVEPLAEPVVSLPVVTPEPIAMPEPVVVPEPIVVPEPVVVSEPSTPIELPQPAIRPAVADLVNSMAPALVPKAAREQERVSFKDLADSLLGAMTATQEALANAQTAADAGTKSAVAEPLVLESAGPTPAAPEPVVAPLELAMTLEAPEETPPALEASARAENAAAEPVLTLESATSIEAPTPAAPERPATETAKTAAPAMPQGFEGLKFPNDGVLTRQWMEFLSQMSTTK